MTATVEAFFAMNYTNAGAVRSFGNWAVPVATLTLQGLSDQKRDVRCPALAAVPAAADAVTAWQWSKSEDFQIMALRLRDDPANVSGAYLYGFYKVDTPVSASDDTPSGANIRWREFDLSCQIPWIWNTHAAVVHPTLATEMGDTGGLPTFLTPANWAARLAARIYQVVLWNPTASVLTAELYALN